MKAEIISIGTELLLGQIANTNAQFISEQLALLGIPVYYHTVVGDNPQRILAQLEISSQRSEILIFTGGLGPTKDDLTKETIAQFLNRSLVSDEPSLKRIIKFFEARHIEMTANNERQAIVIEGAKIFQNDNGLAPGMAVADRQLHYLLFPGPPKELKPMFRDYAVPYLLSILPEKRTVHSMVLRFCGIGESTLETRLQDLIEGQSNPTIAPLAKEGEVTIRVTSLAASVAEAEEMMKEVISEIKARVGEYQYGWDDDSLSSVLVELLKERKLTISCAESCTGGLMSYSISQIPGASQVLMGGTICYTNQVKQEDLGVPQAILDNEGAVSEKAAYYLALGCKNKYKTDIGISITGIAGPGIQEEKPVGLIYIGFALPQHTLVKELRLSGNRTHIQERAVKLAMYHLVKELKKGE